jgi:hypothetical protein
MVDFSSTAYKEEMSFFFSHVLYNRKVSDEMKRLKNMLRGIHMKRTVLIYKARYGYMRGGINLEEAIEGRLSCAE